MNTKEREFQFTNCLKTKVHITSKTESKLEPGVALFSVYRHSISGSVSIVDHEKNNLINIFVILFV